MKVSVLTPTVTGREDFLWRAKCSVRGQTWNRALEHIIEHDAPSPAEGFQRCLDRAIGDLVMPLSDDDWLAPHAVQTLADALDDEMTSMFASGLTLIDGQSIGGLLVVSEIEARGFYLGGAHMWRKEITDTIGGFDYEQFPNAADYDLYWRIAKAAQLAGWATVFVPELLYFYTTHNGTDGNTNGETIQEQCERIRQLHTLGPRKNGARR